MSLLDVVLGNLWRSAAVLLLLAVLGLRLYAANLSDRLETAQDKVDAVTAQRDAAVEQARSAHTSALGWETTALDLQVRLAQWIERERIDKAQDAERIARAKAEAADADATLNAWMDRYAASLHEPKCRQLMETPLCVN